MWKKVSNSKFFIGQVFFRGGWGWESKNLFCIALVYSTEFSIKDSEGTNQTGDVQTDLSFLWLCMPWINFFLFYNVFNTD